MRGRIFRLKAEATESEAGWLPPSGGRILNVLSIFIAAATIVSSQTADVSWPVRFTDEAAAAGLTRPSVYGGVDRKRFILETNGCGTGFIDYDRDGWLDALVLSGTRFEEGSRREKAWPAA